MMLKLLASILSTAVIKPGLLNLKHWLQPSMLNFPLMLLKKLPVADRLHPQSNKFTTGVGNKDTDDTKLNDSPAQDPKASN